MQTIRIDIEESKVDFILNFLSNLKEDIVKTYSVFFTADENLRLDPLKKILYRSIYILYTNLFKMLNICLIPIYVGIGAIRPTQSI